MAPRTRLDTLKKLREQHEDSRLKDLVSARDQARERKSALERAKEASLRDERRAAPAEEWDLVEVAHRRLLLEVKTAAERLRVAEQAEAQAREGHARAQREAEVVRRVIETRQGELRAEAAAAERKSFDELAALAFRQRPGKDGAPGS